jgi:hypothetical protein
MPIVRFVYSKSTASPRGGVMQIHEQVHEILAPGETLTYPELHKAVLAFMEWFAGTFPDSDLIKWTATYADGKGRYAEYAAFLPSNWK